MTTDFRFAGPTRAVVTGATGQDARFLIPLLVDSGAEVHAVARDITAVRRAFDAPTMRHVVVHGADLSNRDLDVTTLLKELQQPDYFFNLAGQSSVHESMSIPDVCWAVNAEWPARLLEALRRVSPHTRLYQASSSEMFGSVPGGAVVHNESSPLHPLSPYAASKAAAHLLCGAYRQTYGLRVACGILFNHESKYRPMAFLTSKVAAHVRQLRASGIDGAVTPLRVGNLDVKRDWGHAAEFARGILLVGAQIKVRSHRSGVTESDEAVNYRDYVFGTGVLTSVRELIDTAFRAGGFELVWELERDGTAARFAGKGCVAVRTDPSLYRPAEPLAILADPSRVAADLGWQAVSGVELFMREMILHASP